MKILITGGSGFVGTNLVEYFYNINDVKLLNIDIVKPRCDNHYRFWRHVDITDFEKLNKVVLDFDPDYVVHLAARTDLNGKILEDYSANILGVQNVLNISQKCPNLKKILITSSMLVCHTGYQPSNQFDYTPSTIYGMSKVKTEEIVWANKPKCDWAILRPTSIWGPWFGEPYRNFFDMVVSKRYFHIGHKSCTKTYGYVGNVVYQIKEILFSTTINENNKVFYLGDEQPTNIEEWGNEIAYELGYKIKRIPFWLIVIAALCGDFFRILGLKFPMTSFRLKNMTTDNIVNLDNTNSIAINPPYTRKDGIKNTLEWIRIHS